MPPRSVSGYKTIIGFISRDPPRVLVTLPSVRTTFGPTRFPCTRNIPDIAPGPGSKRVSHKLTHGDDRRTRDVSRIPVPVREPRDGTRSRVRPSGE